MVDAGILRHEVFSSHRFVSLELSEWGEKRFWNRSTEWKADCFCEPVSVSARVRLFVRYAMNYQKLTSPKGPICLVISVRILKKFYLKILKI